MTFYLWLHEQIKISKSVKLNSNINEIIKMFHSKLHNRQYEYIHFKCIL
jgi:hypothetical protein